MKAPVLSVLQQAWLQELGLDRRALAAWAQSDAVKPTPPATQAAAPAPAAARASRPEPSSFQRARPAMPAAPTAVTPKAAPAVSLPDGWDDLLSHVAACVACDLHTGRSQAVFGHGATETPDWMLIGEAPGDQDDKAGLPFQGKAGVLLHAMLASIGVPVQEPAAIYYTNIVKCRPLGNRPPRAEEIAACRPYLLRQIAVIKPLRVIALGRLAAQALLGVDEELEALRGRVHHLTGDDGSSTPVIATYHPAALLMRPQHKADAWRDLLLARSLTAA